MFEVLLCVEAKVRLIVGADIDGEPKRAGWGIDQNLHMRRWIVRFVMKDLRWLSA